MYPTGNLSGIGGPGLVCTNFLSSSAGSKSVYLMGLVQAVVWGPVVEAAADVGVVDMVVVDVVFVDMVVVDVIFVDMAVVDMVVVDNLVDEWLLWRV